MDEKILEKNIIVTGANGFIGKNLCLFLKENGYKNIYKITRITNSEDFEKYILSADFIFNFAGVNRPKDDSEFQIGNVDYLNNIINILTKNNRKTPIMLSSSTQVELNNIYGESKRCAEEVLKEYAKNSEANIFIYRFPNVFGKWSKPNYNSAVATFCYNISRGMPITINDFNAQLNLLYIDDVCYMMMNLLENYFSNNVIYKDDGICPINNVYHTTVGIVSNIIKSFVECRKNFYSPYSILKDNDINQELLKKLYSTYLSFMPTNNFAYPLVMHKDDRGSFTEILKTLGDGQFSINISKPGITKGGHYHNTKNEKFIVVSGKALIEFTNVEPGNDVAKIKYEVSGEDLIVVDIPCGYAHTITNIGDNDLVTIMWANEVFDENNMDTYKVENDME